MSYPDSPSPATPADSPAWDEYRRVLALSGISVNDFPAHIPSAAPDYDPALDAAEAALDARMQACIREPETPSLAETIQDRDEEREDFLTRAYALHRVLSEQHHLGFSLLSSVTSGPDGNWCRTTEGDLLNVALGSLFSALQCVSLAIDAGRDTK